MSDYHPMAVERHEKATWEAMADIYSATAALLTVHSGQIELVVEHGRIDESSRVLDMGCGSGLLTHALSKVTGAVEGVDFAKQMIAVAQQSFPELTFQVANGEKLPFDDSTFDVVVCNYTAHHFARPESVFKEILRTLASGGRVVVIHPIQAKQAAWNSFAGPFTEELPPEIIPGGALIEVAEPQEYETLLTHCGYANARCEEKVKPTEIQDLNPLLDAAWKVCGLHDQPQEMQDRIRAGTIEQAEPYKTSDGGYSFPDVVLVATASRG